MFDTNYLLSADDMMINILHLAQNMEEELPGPNMVAPPIPASPIFAFVAAGRGSRGERGHPTHGGRGGLGLPNKCGACGSPDHIMSSCMASDEAMFKWTVAKQRKMAKARGYCLTSIDHP